jgi:hypothetical protein
MAGSNYLLDKGFPVLSTYNSSAAAGVLAYRVVKWSSTGIDLQTAATPTTFTLGVVQENVDQAKVATGKAVADVRLAGITKVLVTTATSLQIGARVMAGASGGVVFATTTNQVLGIIVGVGTSGTITAGDLVDVLLVPGVAMV